MSKFRFVVPNLFTSLSLTGAFISLYLIAESLYVQAGLLVFLCMVFDFTDGMVARKLNAMSSFGATFDMMSDFVAFAIVPGFLLFRVSLIEIGFIGAVVAIVYVFSGCYRLIRFYLNDTHSHDKSSFIGLPIPAAASFLSSLVIFFLVHYGINPHPVLLAILMVFVSLLMVSRIEFMALDEKGRVSKFTKYFTLVAVLSLVVFHRYYYLSFFFWLFLYIVYHLLRYFVKVLAGKSNIAEG